MLSACPFALTFGIFRGMPMELCAMLIAGEGFIMESLLHSLRSYRVFSSFTEIASSWTFSLEGFLQWE